MRRGVWAFLCWCLAELWEILCPRAEGRVGCRAEPLCQELLPGSLLLLNFPARGALRLNIWGDVMENLLCLNPSGGKGFSESEGTPRNLQPVRKSRESPELGRRGWEQSKGSFRQIKKV